jgi:transposase-like protein
VAAARTSGIELAGTDGLLTGLTKQVLETALDVELTEHLGYDCHERTGGGGNVRNGSTAKTVRTRCRGRVDHGGVGPGGKMSEGCRC